MTRSQFFTENSKKKKITSSNFHSKTQMKSRILSKTKLREKMSKFIDSHRKYSKNLLTIKSENQKINQRISSLLNIDNICCPICLNPTVFPFVTQCGHFFCYDCSQKAFCDTSKCSVCRQQVKYDYSYSQKMKDIVEILINKISSNEKQSYEKRKNEFQKIQQNRLQLQAIKINDLIDFKQNTKWRQGKITEINNHFISIEITNQKGLRLKKKLIDIRSRKIAKHHTFTQDVLLPTYNPNLVFGYGQQIMRLIDQPIRNHSFLNLCRPTNIVEQPLVLNNQTRWDDFGENNNNQWALGIQQNRQQTFRDFDDISQQLILF